MNRPAKLAAILVGIVVGILVVMAIAITILIDPNRYRDDIIRAVKEHTGRDLKIEGQLSLSLFPWIGLETKRLELSNAPGFGPEPFAVVDSTQTRVALWPLLRKRVVVNGVRLTGLKLHLARRANGRTNWDDLTAPRGEAPNKPTAPSEGPGAALAVFTIERVELRDGELTWRDEIAGAAYALRAIEMKSADVLGGKPAPLHVAFDLEASRPRLRQRVVLDAEVGIDAKTQTLDLPRLQLALGDLRAQAALRGQQILTAPALSGSMEIPAFDPRPLLQQLGVNYAPADSDALRKLALRAKIQYDPKAMALSDLRVSLDHTQVTGNLSATRQSASAYRFDVAVDDIDIDRYLPAPASAPDKKSDEAPNNVEVLAVPVALLRDTDADGSLRIQKLKAFGLRSQEVSAKVSAHRGRVSFGPNAAKLYGGSYAGQTVIDVATRMPQFQFQEKLSSVQLGPLLKDAGMFAHYSGTGNVELKLTAQGRDAEQITRNLNGTAAVNLRDGKIEGVNLQKIVQESRALVAKARGQEVESKTVPSDETAFKTLSASARVTNGVARNDDLKLDGPVVRATGAGTANLVEKKLDYRLQVTLAEDATRKGTTVPLRIDGPFSSLRYRVDLSGVLKEQAKPVEQKIEKKLEKSFGDKLEGLRNKLKR